MLCKMIPRRYTIYSSLVFVLSVFISSLFLSSDSFAVSDYIWTIPSQSGSHTYAPCAETDCSSFNYIIFENFSGNFNSNSSVATISNSVYFCTIRPIYASSLICEFNTSRYPGIVTTNWSLDYSGSVRFTESISSGSCPECEVCEVCPAVPDNPYDNKLDQLIRAVYVCAGTMLVLYFFYCIYRLIIKNSGVK